MAETNSQAKERIIREFETMKSLELSARDLYTRIAADPSVEPQKVRNVFSSLAKDEQQHAHIVQEIVNIVTNAL
jgi:rubrerythrin